MIFLEFMGGDFRGLEETENENPPVGRADSARRFAAFAKPNGKRCGDCHTQKQRTRREGPACPSVFLPMWRRFKKRNDTRVVPYGIFKRKEQPKIVPRQLFYGGETGINGRFVNRPYNLPHQTIKGDVNLFPKTDRDLIC